jgi:2-keto-4-pentenoate hydratase/2-oxohepta-3-ene-1,7-dioic acid hydratase in catechol pathway
VRICRVAVDDDLVFGVVEGVDEHDELLPDAMVALMHGHPFGELRPSGRVIPAADVRFVAPMLPSKIIAVAKNYADHAKEMGGEVPASPMIFLKPSTSVIGPDDPIVLPWQSEQVEHEAELAVVIGRLCRDVPVDRVHEVIFGYTCANDVTARDLQRIDGQWGRAKGFDSFCPLGPWIRTDLEIENLSITCAVNNEQRQVGSSDQMVHDVASLVHWVSSIMTLLPGDVILTGTPAGVGPIRAGDFVNVHISGIGSLRNPVIDSE